LVLIICITVVFPAYSQNNPSKSEQNIYAEMCFLGVDYKNFPKENNRITVKDSAEVYGKEIAKWIEENSGKYLKAKKTPERFLVFTIDYLNQLPYDKAVVAKKIIRSWYEALKFQEEFATNGVSENVETDKEGNLLNRKKIYYVIDRHDLEKLIEQIGK
jgi:hypothetical protein